MSKTVLLTGANGFVGSHITDALLRNGYKVRCLIRSTSNQQWLDNKPVEICYGTLGDIQSLKDACKDVDAVIHNAGVVSAPGRYQYFLHNSEGTRNLLEAAKSAAPDISRFVYVSSQAAAGPTIDGVCRHEDEAENPITPYGESKLVAESHVKKFSDVFPVTIVRPPAIYGPRDIAWLPFFKMISNGWMPLIGNYRELSLTHAQDLARQILLQLEKTEAVNETFFCSPFEPQSFEDFGHTISKVIGSKPRLVTVPDVFLSVVYPVILPILGMVGLKPPFRRDKLPDAIAKRWTITGEKAKELLGFEGKMPLLAGVGQTSEWYRWKKWLESPRDRLKNGNGAKIVKRNTSGGEKDYDATCDLCGLTFDDEVKTKKHYEDDDFIIVDCLICRVPMAVLKEHRSSFTEEEKSRLIKIFGELFGEEHHPDFEQRRIPEHAHVHYRTTPHLLPWQQRPE